MSEVRLIDGNTLRELVTDMAGKAGTKGAYAAVWKCARLIDTAPTITPESLGYRKEVVGRWIWYESWSESTTDHMSECEEAGYYCSNCKIDLGSYLTETIGETVYVDNSLEPPKLKICPNCGARMDGEP